MFPPSWILNICQRLFELRWHFRSGPYARRSPPPQCFERARTITPAHESISCQTAKRNRATVRRNSSSAIERRWRSGQRGSFILRYDETQASGLLTREQHRTAAPYGSPFRTLIWGGGERRVVSTQTWPLRWLILQGRQIIWSAVRTDGKWLLTVPMVPWLAWLHVDHNDSSQVPRDQDNWTWTMTRSGMILCPYGSLIRLVLGLFFPKGQWGKTPIRLESWHGDHTDGSQDSREQRSLTEILPHREQWQVFSGAPWFRGSH